MSRITRSQVLVDPSAPIVDSSGAAIGNPGLRVRIVSALPTNKTAPQPMSRASVVTDPLGLPLADADGNLIARTAWCHRLVFATRT